MKKIKYTVRSFRIKSELIKKAKALKMNINGFIDDAMCAYLNGNSNCPTCNKKLEHKKD